MNKRGESEHHFDFVVSLAILLVIAVVVLLFFNQVKEKASAQSTVELCRESVELSALTKVGGIQTYDALQCPTEYTALTEDDEKEIKQQLAQEMLNCFYKFGQGKLELFQLKPGTEINYCAVCSVIEFKGDAAGVPIKDFTQFLVTEKVPRLYGTETYYEFLYGESAPVGFGTEAAKLNDDLSSEVPYAVLFFYAKKSHINKLLGTGIGTAGGLVVGSVVAIAVTGGLGIIPVAVGVVAAVAGGTTGYLTGSDDSASWHYATVLYPYTSDMLKQMDCEELPIAQGNK